MKRQVYLAMKTLQEAREIFFARFGPERRTSAETIMTSDGLGRITAEAVFAKRSAPSYHSAAMDGIAVFAEKTYGATERYPKTMKIGEDGSWINTGQGLPEGLDAVIMVEKLHQIDEAHVEIRAPAYPWQHVRKVGEDIVATQLLLPQNHRIRPYDVGALISGGVFCLKVWEKPRVAIIPTGSELVNHRALGAGESLRPGQIIEYNSVVLAGLVTQSGGIPIIFDIVPDVEQGIRRALEQAVESDVHIIIINAGSSAGSKDYTVHVISEMGEVLVHGVAMMPGKPTILGVVKGKPVVGNPGYAVSSTLSFDQFVKPLIYGLLGCRPPKADRVMVQPTRDIPSRLGYPKTVSNSDRLSLPAPPRH